MSEFKGCRSISAFGAALLFASVLAVGCAGTKAAIPLDVTSLRTHPTAASVGFDTPVGVPSLPERISERPGLKLAVLQVAYKIEGRPEMTFTSDYWQFGGHSTWTETTTPEISVPTDLARESAVDLTLKLQSALAAQGFEVVSYEDVAKTAAYAKFYGDYPVGYNLENGWTVVGAYPMKVKQATNLIDYATLHWVWPDTEALPAIKADLGEDVLFLNLQIQVGTMKGGSAGLDVAASVTVTDPDYVGYGIGGFGHVVLSMNANTGAKVDVPGFLRRDGDLWVVNWTPVFEDLVRIHKSFADGFAQQLHEFAHPPAG
ncbi:MAG: hypothetical protein H6825_15445 [Planctomycetes bacterium]|nr:hypothetical protein [Planctomycetota bacterium]